MRLIIGPMVCINIAKRRLPIFAFIISSIGAICVIMSSPPPPPPRPANCAFAGIDVSVNNSSSVAAWQTTLSAPVMVLFLMRRRPRTRRHWDAWGEARNGRRADLCERSRCLASQRFLHGQHAQIHLRVHVGCDLVRQHVGGPYEAGAAIARVKDLGRGAVLPDAFADDGVDQPPLVVVAVDHDLARYGAVGECHD